MSVDFMDMSIGGPDMSGTTLQIKNIIGYFQGKGEIVRDIRGTEIDALFHAEKFLRFNKSKIALYVWEDAWNELPTDLRNEDGDYYTYRSPTPHFSI